MVATGSSCILFEVAVCSKCFYPPNSTHKWYLCLMINWSHLQDMDFFFLISGLQFIYKGNGDWICQLHTQHVYRSIEIKFIPYHLNFYTKFSFYCLEGRISLLIPHSHRIMSFVCVGHLSKSPNQQQMSGCIDIIIIVLMSLIFFLLYMMILKSYFESKGQEHF